MPWVAAAAEAQQTKLYSFDEDGGERDTSLGTELKPKQPSVTKIKILVLLFPKWKILLKKSPQAKQNIKSSNTEWEDIGMHVYSYVSIKPFGV